MPPGYETTHFRGKSGLLYKFARWPWSHALPSEPGLYLFTARYSGGGTGGELIIYVGEASDMSKAFLGPAVRGCLAKYTGKSKWSCPNPFGPWREGARDDLVAAHDPPCNRHG